jgi:putative NADPH-quinone reductase
MSLNRSQSDHHLSHLPIAEANIIVSKQRLQREVRGLYRLREENAAPEEIKKQQNRIRAAEIIIRQLERDQASTVS